MNVSTCRYVTGDDGSRPHRESAGLLACFRITCNRRSIIELLFIVLYIAHQIRDTIRVSLAVEDSRENALWHTVL